MTDKELKENIADIIMDAIEEYNDNELNRPMIASLYASKIIASINFLPEEPVSEDLEKAAWLYADKIAHLDNAVFTSNALEKERTRLSFDWYDIRETFKAGAQWKGKIAKKEVIEKAVTWIKEHKEAVETEDNGIMGWIPDYFIEDFKKALEGDSV